MALLSGSMLQGRYNIGKPLGQGGMGMIYYAQDQRLNNRPVAVKELDPFQLPVADRQEAVDAFRQEARILASLDHPNLTHVYDSFDERGLSYLVMEYVPGDIISQPGSRFSVKQVLTWGRTLCEVLIYLHAQQPPVVFRDLKPSNIMLQPDGHLKLIDFGIARHFKPGKSQDTVRFGTPGYAPLEQYNSQTEPRSDIYALAVILYEWLTGDDVSRHPFKFPQMGQLSPDIQAMLLPCLDDDYNQRPTASQLAQQLDQLLKPIVVINSCFHLDPADPATIINDIEQLCAFCDARWVDAVRFFKTRRIEQALVFLNHANGLSVLRTVYQSDANIGLESLLRELDTQRAKRNIQLVNREEINNELGLQFFGRWRGTPPAQLLFELHNPNKRGYLWGRIDARVDWLTISQPVFGCAAGQTIAVDAWVDIPKWRRQRWWMFFATLYEIETETN